MINISRINNVRHIIQELQILTFFSKKEFLKIIAI